MSIAEKAARGAAWTILGSVAGRAIGVVGTLVMTRFLSPEVIGEVSIASIICATATWLTTIGIGQYLIVNGRGDDATATEVTWHATVAYFILSIIAMVAVLAIGGRLATVLEAPHAALFVPGMALAVFLRRMGYVAERVLVRSLRFRAVGLSLGIGEAAYTGSALILAARGYGGMSMVYANIVQSIVVVGITFAAAGFRSWLTCVPLQLKRFRDMWTFGLPIAVGGFAHGASRYWDNLTISRFFGPAATGTYNLAYNLADIPAVHIGEQIAGVLLPSFASLPQSERAAAAERAARLLSLILFPLAVGLALVSSPLIATILPADKWQEVAPLLVILTSLSVFRPFIYVLSAYMEAERRNRRLMYLEFGKLIVMLGGIAVLSRFGLRVAASAVGLSFAATAFIATLLVSREGLSRRALLFGFLQPLLACGVMSAAVLATHLALHALGITKPIVMLIVEIAVGAVSYVPAAFVLCSGASRDLITILKRLREPRAKPA